MSKGIRPGADERSGRSVLFVHPSDEAYGADRVLLRLAVGLRDRGWRVGVLLSDDQPPGWLSEMLAHESLEVRRGPLAPARRQNFTLKGLPGYVRQLGTARRWIRGEARRFQPAILHVNTSALLVGAMLGRPAGVRLIWHVHEIVIRPRVVNWIFRLAPTLTSSRVVAVSRAVRDHLSPKGLGRRRITVVWNGIEPRPVVPLASQDGGVVAFVGRLNRWKGWDIYIRAVARIAGAFPDARFLIVGDPPKGEEATTQSLRRAVESLGIASRVEIVGFVPDIPGLLERVAIVAVPSIWPDPFPLITLEGMRAGRAVIATAHGGALDVIEPGVSGMLVPPGDDVALSTALTELLLDPALRERIGAAAHRRIESAFSDVAFLDRMESAYRNALGE